MYAALGNQEQQAEIIAENPKAQHCNILKERKNPWGCINFDHQPEEQQQEWHICPNNPYFYKDGIPIPECWKGNRPIRESFEQMERKWIDGELIVAAYEIYYLHQDSLESIPSAEHTLVTFMRNYETAKRMEAQAKIIAVEVGKVVAKMFGEK